MILLVVLAAAWDLQTRRIPNWLVATALLVALPMQCALHGVLGGVQLWLFGCLVGGLMFFPGYLMRMVGAGDVKLTAAVGSFCGALAVVQIAVIACVIGGIWALITLIRRRHSLAGSNYELSMLSARPAVAQVVAQADANVDIQVDTQAEVESEVGAAPSADSQYTEAKNARAIGRLPYGAAIALSTVCVLLAGA
ncbi:prepilin peptidase [Paraburkholderia sp. DHOC27]|uniref:A24 family peptidase n=1 Tax=Paraburkholderia sp. DHOC27 TaxID=2303330 RepID=UPI00216AC1B7|nr:prepilin peptidase [Paraburkholderia sp. DHOC27]